jgi:hypothetical protein
MTQPARSSSRRVFRVMPIQIAPAILATNSKKKTAIAGFTHDGTRS